MPTEIRHIICSAPEVVGALQLFYRTRQKPLPAGSVVSIIVHDEPEISAELEMQTDRDNKRLKIRANSEELAAALILFCRENSIPLPADGVKVLQKFGDSVGLIVTRNPRNKDLANKITKPVVR